jgi:nitrogen fixation NifU-like protein
VYGPVAAEHLKRPRNLGKLADADGVGTVDDPGSETLLTIYLKLATRPDGRRIVEAAQFRAFGCGGCIVTGSIATELAIGRPVDELPSLDGAAINRALDDGLPPEQRYCAELAARALHLAAQAACR